MSHVRPARTVEGIAIILFFVQAFRVVISALFGILYDHGFEGQLNVWSVGAVMLMAVAFLAPLIPTQKRAPLALLLAALVAAVARPILNVNELMPRYWAGLIVLAAGSAYLATLIRGAPEAVAPSLAGGLVIDQVLRALGNTYDLSLRPEFLATQVAISLALAGIAIWQFVARPTDAPTPAGKLGTGSGLALGAGLFILTSLLTLPNAIARWSNFEYAALAPALVALTCLPLAPQFGEWTAQLQSNRKVAQIAIVLIGLAVGYQRWGIWSALGLVTVYAALLVTLTRLVGASDDARPDRTSMSLALGLLLLLALNIALAFTFTYPYTLRLMQGMGLPVYLIAGLIAVLPPPPPPHPLPRCAGEGQGVGALALLAVIVVLVATFPISVGGASQINSVTAATYTIRYGFDNRWCYALEDMARAIEQSGADIVTLQEVDTGRLTSLGVDDTYYLARRLGMNSYYLPTVERLTGLAVLSRLPIIQAEGRLITSQQEQTGILHAQLAADGRDLHVYDTWLGIRGEDTQRQIAEVISVIGNRSPTVLGGAFNTEPGSSAYAAINDAGFDFSAFGLGAPSPYVRARDPAPHTDYVWLRGLTPLRGWLPRIPATNHKLVAVRFALP